MTKWRVTIDYGEHGLIQLGDVMGNSPEDVENKLFIVASTIRNLGGQRYLIHREGEGPAD